MAIKLASYKAGESKKSYQYSFFMPTAVNAGWQWTSSAINQSIADQPRRAQFLCPVVSASRILHWYPVK